MKTFLWTSLFWIVVAIACLLCLGFGNLGTQVLENDWVAIVMPKNLKAESCDAVVTSTLESIDWCAVAKSHDCNDVDVEGKVEETDSDTLTGETAWLQEPLSSIIANQEIIYKYLQESMENLNKSISELQNASALKDSQQTLIDEKEQQKLQLQAQIEALQNEMANL